MSVYFSKILHFEDDENIFYKHFSISNIVSVVSVIQKIYEDMKFGPANTPFENEYVVEILDENMVLLNKKDIATKFVMDFPTLYIKFKKRKTSNLRKLIIMFVFE